MKVNKFKINFPLTIFIFLAIFFQSACGELNGNDLTDGSTSTDTATNLNADNGTDTSLNTDTDLETNTVLSSGQLELQLDLESIDDEETLMTRVSVKVYNQTITENKHYTIDGENITITMDDIPEGNYEMEVNIYEYESIISQNVDSLIIVKDEVTRLELDSSNISLSHESNSGECTGEQPVLNDTCQDDMSIMEYNRSLWQSQDLEYYEFTYSKWKEGCADKFKYTNHYTVVNGNAVNITGDDGIQVDEDGKTIDDVFQEILTNLESGDYQIAQSDENPDSDPFFNAVYGYPEVIYFAPTDSVEGYSIALTDVNRLVLPLNFAQFSTERSYRILDELDVYAEENPYWVHYTLNSISPYFSEEVQAYRDTKFLELYPLEVIKDNERWFDSILYLSISGNDHIYHLIEGTRGCVINECESLEYQVTFAPDGTYSSNYDEVKNAEIRPIQIPSECVFR